MTATSAQRIRDVQSYGGKFIRATECDANVLLLELNRPPVNAFHDALWRDLGATFRRIDKDVDVRVVVLASALQLFTAGIDVTSGLSLAKGDSPVDVGLRARDHLLEFQAAISAIEECRQPVIAAVQGLALGLAVDILCACDIRYAGADAVFSIMEVDVGLAADIGTLSRLPKIIGSESAVRELALTARRFTADEALALGFVSAVKADVREFARATARAIASKPPIAVVGTKHLLLHARDHTVNDSLAYTAAWNQLMLQTPDIPEALTSRREKQPPRFRPLPKL